MDAISFRRVPASAQDEQPASLTATDDLNYDDELDQTEGNYSTRMEAFLDNDDDHHEEDEESDEEVFIYTGVDAEPSTSTTNYRDKLKSVLGADHDEEDETDSMSNGGRQVNIEDTSRDEDDEPMQLSDLAPSNTSAIGITPPRVESPINGAYHRLGKTFLHPTVSRLRSYTPQGSPMLNASTSSAGTSRSHAFGAPSPSPSHFSAMSRMSSISNFQALSASDQDNYSGGHSHKPEREIFRWSVLRNIGQQIYAPTSTGKATSLLGSSAFGAPTVLAANGFICIGTDQGRVHVYDFKQTPKCVCGSETIGKTCGPVTALALSFDHTFVAVGHATGHIQLYDLKTPHVPARSVPPTTLAAVSSGRKEGHLQGSQIVSIGFVASRHTAVVSADEHGLAFYHSLGKVLFVDAVDVLRILGKYPLDGPSATTPFSPTTPGIPPTPATATSPSSKPVGRYTVLAMGPLPLGTAAHPTDPYNIIALLTPTKLVIVGLKPSPRTWFKIPRSQDIERPKSRSRWKGTLSWFPCVVPNGAEPATPVTPTKGKPTPQVQVTTPVLAFTWGNVLQIIRISEAKIKQTVTNSKTGKQTEVEVGTIVHEQVNRWAADGDILAIQWLNLNQIVVVTATSMQVYDCKPSKIVEGIHFDGLSLLSPGLKYTVDGSKSYADTVGEVAHSMRVYKGKIFLLGRENVQVGTLVTWADRILSAVQDGDFLTAIEVARSYYVGDHEGNANGLPEDPEQRKNVVGQKMRDLMTASTRYAFSEDRMSDQTHFTTDGRGVDRTSLFENLVFTCARACVALDDFEFLFEDVFQEYDDAGISKIFLLQLEHFVLDNEIRYVPPRITQRLVSLHAEDERPELVERIIWHIDPQCLDINQAIMLCQKHGLYDALIYVYTRALRDYVAPVVELLGLIRQVSQFRRSKEQPYESWTEEENTFIEPLILNAYKIYPYLANILSGLTYPSEEPLPDDEAFQARKDIYTFLFFGRSSVWPAGEGGKLVLTADEDGGVEPTYPYARQLLRHDAESFLHSLDIAFEDAYLNNDSLDVNRLVIIRILMDIVSSEGVSPEDATFVNIFVARNVPKYPQFLHMAPSTLHSILVDLAEDPSPNTREDRQLAAEYLLSSYNPHEGDRILELFRDAGFFRILRTWHRQEKRWVSLLTTYLEDEELHAPELFEHIDEVILASKEANLPQELMAVIADSLPQLLHSSLSNAAALVEKHFPNLHDQAMECLGDAGHRKFIYLQQLLAPPSLDNADYLAPPRESTPSQSIPKHLRQLYISLQCEFHPKEVISTLEYLPQDYVDWNDVIQTCETKDVYDAAVWALNSRDEPMAALSKAEQYEKELTLNIVDLFADHTQMDGDDAQRFVEALERIGKTGVSVCLGRSEASSAVEVPLEDMWFKLLSSQLACVQTISESCSVEALAATDTSTLVDHATEVEWNTLRSLREVVQATFTSLVSITSTRTVSFPSLFKRLVTSTTNGYGGTTGTRYTEFRTILTGMLESYRSDGDILVITKHLVDRDLFQAVAKITRERGKGWSAAQGTCQRCREPLSKAIEGGNGQIVVSRTGVIYHRRATSIINSGCQISFSQGECKEGMRLTHGLRTTSPPYSTPAHTHPFHLLSPMDTGSTALNTPVSSPVSSTGGKDHFNNIRPFDLPPQAIRAKTLSLELSRTFDQLKDVLDEEAISGSNEDLEPFATLRGMERAMAEQSTRHTAAMMEIQAIFDDLVERQVIEELEKQVEEEVASVIEELVEEEVNRCLAEHIPTSLIEELEEKQRELEELRWRFHNSESKRLNADLRTESDLTTPLNAIYRPNGEISPLFPRTLEGLLALDVDVCKGLVAQYNLPVSEETDLNLNQLMQFCGLQYQMVKSP